MAWVVGLSHRGVHLTCRFRISGVGFGDLFLLSFFFCVGPLGVLEQSFSIGAARV